MSEVIPIAETVTIGGDLTVGRIGFGAMRLTGDQVWGDYPDHDGGIALLRHVVDSGVTFIDTADVYGPHSNEELIREALHPYPRDLVIATIRPQVSAASAVTKAWGFGGTSTMTTSRNFRTSSQRSSSSRSPKSPSCTSSRAPHGPQRRSC